MNEASQIGELYDILDSVFDVKKHKGNKGWEYLRSHVSGEQVREIYSSIQSLWPEKLDIQDYLPSSSNGKLRSIYVGNTHSSRISKNIARYSLYTDEIVLPVLYRSTTNQLGKEGIYVDNYCARER